MKTWYYQNYIAIQLFMLVLLSTGITLSLSSMCLEFYLCIRQAAFLHFCLAAFFIYRSYKSASNLQIVLIESSKTNNK